MRAFFALLGLLALTPALTAQENIAYEVYLRPYFVKNNAKLPGNPAVLVLQDKKAFDQVFGVAFVRGLKVKLVNDKLFEKNLIVTAIKSGKTPWQYEVQKVRVDKKKLIVEFTAKGTESATAKFTSPLILGVARGDFTEVVFIENGKEIGKQKIEK